MPPLDSGNSGPVCPRCDAPGFRILVVRRLDSWFRAAGTSRFCSESSIRTGNSLAFGVLPPDADSSGMRDPFALRSCRILVGVRGVSSDLGIFFSSFRKSWLSFTAHTPVSSVEFRVVSFHLTLDAWSFFSATNGIKNQCLYVFLMFLSKAPQIFY